MGLLVWACWKEHNVYIKPERVCMDRVRNKLQLANLVGQSTEEKFDGGWTVGLD